MHTVFDAPASEISTRMAAPQAVARDVEEGLVTPDRDLYLAQFHPDAAVIDPIVPRLTPGVAEHFDVFGRAGTLCSTWSQDAVYVNDGGALASVTCEGFYRKLPGAEQLPEGIRLLRHLPMTDGLVDEEMHRYDIETAAAYPVESVLAIGFEESLGSEVSSQASSAAAFIDRFSSAWASADPREVARLYAEQATRHDGYVGDRAGRQAIADWHSRLFEAYPEISVENVAGYASGVGPAARFSLTTSAGGEACVMRLGAVWDLDDRDLVVDEYVYYAPDTALACGWAAGR